MRGNVLIGAIEVRREFEEEWEQGFSGRRCAELQGLFVVEPMLLEVFSAELGEPSGELKLAAQRTV